MWGHDFPRDDEEAKDYVRDVEDCQEPFVIFVAETKVLFHTSDARITAFVSVKDYDISGLLHYPMFDLSRKAKRYSVASSGTTCVSSFRRTRFAMTGSISSAVLISPFASNCFSAATASTFSSSSVLLCCLVVNHGILGDVHSESKAKNTEHNHTGYMAGRGGTYKKTQAFRSGASTHAEISLLP